MSAWALTDAWPGPVAYLEAELRNRKGCSGAKQLRVAYLHANAAARKAGVVFGPNMRVPQESVMGRCFDSLVPSGMDGEARNQAGSRKEGDEELSTWTYSDGGRLNTCRVHVRAEARLERGQARVYAFVSPVSPVSPVRAAPATQTGD